MELVWISEGTHLLTTEAKGSSGCFFPELPLEVLALLGEQAHDITSVIILFSKLSLNSRDARHRHVFSDSSVVHTTLVGRASC